MQEQNLNIVIDEEYAGARLDKALAELFPAFSRAFLQRCIKQGRVRVDGAAARPRDLVGGGERVDLELTEADLPGTGFEGALAGEDLPLSVLHEDDALLVLDKPVGMVVHPGAGRPGGTLVNALVFCRPALKFLPRAGLVHRLDKDTSGLLVVAKTRAAHKSLAGQMQARTIRREYLCLVHGEVISGGRVAAPLGRHPRDRKRMAVVAGARAAVTHYRVLARFRRHTLLSVRLETGRTHQIRVHLAHIRHPVVGDAVYGGHRRTPAVAGAVVIEALREFGHQALHAHRLRLAHPVTGEVREWRSEPPPDLRALLDLLSAHEQGPARPATWPLSLESDD